MEKLKKEFIRQFIALHVLGGATLVIAITFYIVFFLDVYKYWVYIIFLSIIFVPLFPFLVREVIGYYKDFKCLKEEKIPIVTGKFIGYKKVNVGGDPPEEENRIIIMDYIANKQIILKAVNDIKLREDSIYSFYYLPFTKFSMIIN